MSPERCTLFGDVGMTTSDLQCITASTHVGSLAFVNITMNEIKDKTSAETSAEKVMLCPWCCHHLASSNKIHQLNEQWPLWGEIVRMLTKKITIASKRYWRKFITC